MGSPTAAVIAENGTPTVVERYVYDIHGQSFTTSPEGCRRADIDCDGLIGAADLVLVRNAYTDVASEAQGARENICGGGTDGLEPDDVIDEQDLVCVRDELGKGVTGLYADSATGDDDPFTGDLPKPTQKLGLHGLPIDESTGLVYARARYYHPTLGRWMARDPKGYVDGGNLYEAFGSNHARFADPMGTEYMEIDNETGLVRFTRESWWFGRNYDSIIIGIADGDVIWIAGYPIPRIKVEGIAQSWFPEVSEHGAANEIGTWSQWAHSWYLEQTEIVSRSARAQNAQQLLCDKNSDDVWEQDISGVGEQMIADQYQDLATVEYWKEFWQRYAVEEIATGAILTGGPKLASVSLNALSGSPRAANFVAWSKTIARRTDPIDPNAVHLNGGSLSVTCSKGANRFPSSLLDKIVDEANLVASGGGDITDAQRTILRQNLPVIQRRTAAQNKVLRSEFGRDQSRHIADWERMTNRDWPAGATPHHIVPLESGGANAWYNLVPTHGALPNHSLTGIAGPHAAGGVLRGTIQRGRKALPPGTKTDLRKPR